MGWTTALVAATSVAQISSQNTIGKFNEDVNNRNAEVLENEKIAIANKESIICGWNLISKELGKNKTNFIPVDSEHFSIWYALNNIKKKRYKKNLYYCIRRFIAKLSY